MNYTWEEPQGYKDLHQGYDREESLQLLSNAICAELFSLFKSNDKIDPKKIRESLRYFYSNYHYLCEILCPGIILETIEEIKKAKSLHWNRLPQISYVIPAYKVEINKFTSTLKSLKNQIGVFCNAIIVLDGPNEEEIKNVKLACNAIAKDSQNFSLKVIIKTNNSGVARARNTAMKHITTEYFSFLDANDILHPLRSLHSILYLKNYKAERVETSYARICLSEKKLIMRNGMLKQNGHTSFVSETSLIERYGYLCDLTKHEDTEYRQRLNFFRVAMIKSEITGHFLDIELKERGKHLSSDTWSNIEILEDHSFLSGTYISKANQERQEANYNYFNRYEQAQKEIAKKYFPAIE